ncbi:MAG: hypothetical protein CXT78_06665 [Thaumarchaeota archaeon]|jgi:O-antigen/teichoic acid export membrane protein|nr:MAG: hypothetical protein CXT78_06665 [Nitrososphaerota archaeon]
MSDIRVTYIGLISFMGGLIALVTGSIFSLIITRTLTPEEYGHWGLIFSVISYFAMLIPMFAYWSTREIARKKDSGKTSVFSTIGFSIISSTIFIPIALIVSFQTGSNQTDFLFATMLIPAIFINGILASISLGYKPQVISISSISFGLVQVPSVLFFVYFLDMGIIGIILTMLLAYTASILVFTIFIRKKLKNSFKFFFLKKWLKLFWIPLYPSTYTILAESTILIFTVMTGSIIGVAYWIASIVLASVISPAGLISRAVYPKLLDDNSKDFFRDNVTYLFYFTILFTSIVITFAKPGLFVLNPFYEKAVLVVVIIAVESFLTVLINMFQLSLIGIEKIDIISHATFKDYVKSKLFYVYTLRLIQVIVYIIIFVIMLQIFTSSASSDITLLIYWATIAMVTQIPLTIILGIMIKHNFPDPFDYIRITKFFIISVLVFAVAYYMTENYLNYTNDLYHFLPSLILLVVFAVGLYLISTYIVDSKIRTLFNSIIYEIKNKIN